MSQITRCPACHTCFKVVADQLRISEGWVRCGQCHEVFDAAKSLQPAPAGHLMPEMPLNELRGPVARPTPQSRTPSAWGVRAAVVPFAQPVPPPADGTIPLETDGDGFAPTEPGALDLPKAQFAPKAPEQALAPSSDLLDLPGSEQAQWQTLVPGGYELPSAEESDFDSAWPGLLDMLPQEAHKVEALGREALEDASEPDLEALIAQINGAAPLADARREDGGAAASSEALSPLEDPAPDDADADADADVQAEHGSQSWTLVPDEVSADVPALALPGQSQRPDKTAGARARTKRKKKEKTDPKQALENPEGHEPSFVRSARRRAFWSGAGVRVGLLLVAVALLVALAAQVVLQERTRVVAMWPQSRTWMETACAYLRCSVGLHRDITAVLVDGSSFNRVQGDRYQFSLTLRNRSHLPVETPAIELTLTDTDEQPVVRRVLAVSELAAPSPLMPGQEWSTVTAMSIGSGNARIAGYRVLAFYP